MQSPAPQTIALVVLAPLLAWRVYSRFRRMVGRQRLSRIRPWITLTLFPLLTFSLVLSSRTHWELLAALLAAVGGGALLGVYGLRHTRFEPTPQGLFYTPHTYFGIALTVLLVGRIFYRLIEVYLIGPALPHDGTEFLRSPLTLAVFGLLAGYYVAYAIGLVRWRNRLLLRKKIREAAAADEAKADI